MSGVNFVDFLLARLDEDRERYVKGSRQWAECEAKRRMVARKPRLSARDDVQDVWWDLMALLAEVYADHPDYDPDWRP